MKSVKSSDIQFCIYTKSYINLSVNLAGVDLQSTPKEPRICNPDLKLLKPYNLPYLFNSPGSTFMRFVAAYFHNFSEINIIVE